MNLHPVDFRTLTPEVFQVFGTQNALLTAGDRNNCNTMTIGWCQMGRLWSIPVCTVYVRPERYTYQFMESHDYFTVSVLPLSHKQTTMQVCGTQSGRDIDKIKEVLSAEKPKMAYIQRSRGYSTRPSYKIADIEKVIKAVREVSPDSVIMVDNCYGEFVEKLEPTQVGADIIAGSLIKNPGGGIAPTGGYIAGRRDLIEKCSYRLTCSGVGREVGATLGHSRELYLGLFSAPHVVGEAVKTAVYTAALFELLGFDVTPSSEEKRGDIIQCVTLGSADGLVAFCQGMQSGAPVDSFVVPEPWEMPGYTDPVIMAAGAFTLGASIELSADGPLREPYAAWMQGGLNFHSAKAGVLLAAQKMLEKGAIEKLK